MRRKYEEDLIRFAFGDLDGVEANRVADMAQADSETAKAIESYRQLRSELRQLANVPEPQLSKERLRDRILTDGLKPEGVRWGWSWSLAPLAAAALAFVVVYRSQPITEPRIQMDTNAVASRIGADPKMDVAKTLPIEKVNVATDSGPKEDLKATPVAVRRPGPRLVRNKSSRLASGVVVSNFGMDSLKFKADKGVGSPSVSTVTFRSEPEPPVVAISMPDMAVPDTSVVLIQTDTDSGAGANRATEVSASNVLIGG